MTRRPPCPLPDARAFPRPQTEAEAMSASEARAEAARCLSTHPCLGCEVCSLICPDQAITHDPATGRPVIDLAYCKGCGLCAHLCPKDALKMVLEPGD